MKGDTMKQHSDTKISKQQYEKPRLRVIELSADEVLAIGCKTGSSGFSPLKPPPCAAHQCAKNGS
jgi:hypothetical protein